jgi:uncharacterized damage-inducible protein DinB
MTEAERIADQFHRAFAGPSWHGDSVYEILQGITAKQAAARPIPNAHTIWEILLHMIAWGQVVKNRIEGKREDLPEGDDWPAVKDTSEEAWRKAQDQLKGMCRAMRHSVIDLDDMRLFDFAPGCDYDIYVMLHGLIQHCIYHAGQIALLKKLTSEHS